MSVRLLRVRARTGQATAVFRMRKNTLFYQRVLKLGANEASAQGLQNALRIHVERVSY
jgi:hypothetical protein